VIFLELTLFRCLGFQFNFDYHLTVLNVLWALGWAMIVLSALVHLPSPLVTAFGLVVFAWHNLLDPIQSSNAVWSILHSPNFILANPQHSVFVAYPLIPCGRSQRSGIRPRTNLCLGIRRRRTFLLRAGLGLTATFVILRGVNNVWRSSSLDHAEMRSLQSALISEYQQISAVTVVPPDDARSGAAFSLGG
jgi:uncharacterized membrane protein